jgi:hypothetical protein
VTDDADVIEAQQAARREFREKALAALEAYRAALEAVAPAVLALAERFDQAEAAGKAAQEAVARRCRVEGEAPADVLAWRSSSEFTRLLAQLGIRGGELLIRPGVERVDRALEEVGRA